MRICTGICFLACSCAALAAYAKELSKLPALLRTAKAQPFPPVKATALCRSNAS